MSEPLIPEAAPAPLAATTSGSDRDISADLIGRLRAHYLKPSDRLPAGVFLPEVGWNGTSSTRRCDALFVGFTSASSRHLVGHEIKASRSDWLNELRQLDKADAWADQCHQWWLVTIPGVVRDGELPTGWGLMLPGTSRTRMKIAVHAKTLPDRTPSWDTARSIIARLNTLHRGEVAGILTEERAKMAAEMDSRVEQQVAWRTANLQSDTDLHALVDRMETALGGSLSRRSAKRWFTDAELHAAGEWLAATQDLTRATRPLQNRYQIGAIRSQLDHVKGALLKLQALDDALATIANIQDDGTLPAAG